MKWTQEEVNKAVELKNKGYSSFQISKAMNGAKSAASIRRKLHRIGESIQDNTSVENDDGSQTSSTILEIMKGQELTPDDILRAHHFDVSKWELVRNTSNFWKSKPESTLYQSKVIVRPKTGIDIDELVRIINTSVKPIQFTNMQTGEHNLVITLADLHFGIMTFSDMRHVLDQLVSLVSKGYKTIDILMLGDTFHSDFVNKSETVNGTMLDEVDMPQAIEDAKSFFYMLIKSCVENSKNTEIKFVGGNHSFSLEYMFTEVLKAMFPQVNIDLNNRYRSAFMLDNVAIMMLHGDVAVKKAPMLFATEYSKLWGQAEHRFIFSGHFHYEHVKDDSGCVTYQVGTPKKNDNYELKNGYTMANHKQEAFEFTANDLHAVYYLNA